MTTPGTPDPTDGPTAPGTDRLIPAETPAELARRNAELRARVAEPENANHLETGT